jgi:hypothetical protein
MVGDQLTGARGVSEDNDLQIAQISLIVFPFLVCVICGLPATSYGYWSLEKVAIKLDASTNSPRNV